MTITITINTDNAAFADGNAGTEVSTILRKLAGKVEDWAGENEFTLGLRDLNGNRVGECKAES